MKPSDILNRAADIMIEKGHTKKRLTDDDGRVCLMGAILFAERGEDGYCATLHFFVTEAINYHSISAWNDRPETTETMALGALHEAALLAKAAGE